MREIRLSYQFTLDLNEIQRKIVDELSYHTTRLYNIVNYDITTNGYRNYYKTVLDYTGNFHSKFLHAHTCQQLLRILDSNWKAYFAAKKDYDKNSNKYKGMPRPPKYKNIDNMKNEIIFTNYGVRYKDGILKLSLSKHMQEIYDVKCLNFVVSEKIQKLVDLKNVQQIKLKYDKALKCWKMIVVYEKSCEIINKENCNIMAVDIGLNNLAACTNFENEQTLLINGKTIKSYNRYINNKIAKLQSLQMKKTGNTKYKNTKQIIKLKENRKNYMSNYLHKASRIVINYAKENKCSKIIIGNLKNIKQNMNYNKSFVEIPIERLVDLIEYKAQLAGIELIKIKESYTSGVSSLDNEIVEKKYYNKTRRIKRGLFKSNKGILINADINGSINILRKYIGYESIPKLVKLAMDKGYTSSPVKSLIA